jgi:hypothetical protein
MSFANSESFSFKSYANTHFKHCGFKKVTLLHDKDGKEIDIEMLFSGVMQLGGADDVSNNRQWRTIALRCNLLDTANDRRRLIKFYKQYLLGMEGLSEVVDRVLMHTLESCPIYPLPVRVSKSASNCSANSACYCQCHAPSDLDNASKPPGDDLAPDTDNTYSNISTESPRPAKLNIYAPIVRRVARTIPDYMRSQKFIQDFTVTKSSTSNGPTESRVRLQTASLVLRKSFETTLDNLY